MDYILLIRQSVTLKPNAEEVQATRYVTLPELREMMHVDSGLQWSPWFRIIAENFLERWWDNLDEALTTDAFAEVNKIHKIL